MKIHHLLRRHRASPLDRIAQQYGAGSAWHTHGKSVKTEYRTNTGSSPLNCKLYSVNGDNLAGGTAYYANGMLQVVKTSDEDSKYPTSSPTNSAVLSCNV